MNPKILCFDIETSPILAYVWGLKDQNVSLGQIKEDWQVIAWAAKWLGEPVSKIRYEDQRQNKTGSLDDRALLTHIWKLLNEADIVITQNGRNFDSKKLNARFILHGMRPPSPYTHLDTYQIVKRVAKFTSNKLEYLTDKLNTKYKKLSHKEFPGFSLWSECLKGNQKAWKAMERYNKHDVLSTEELYLNIQGWAVNSAPAAHSTGCKRCGSFDIKPRGYGVNKHGQYRKYHCESCGAWPTAGRV